MRSPTSSQNTDTTLPSDTPLVNAATLNCRSRFQCGRNGQKEPGINANANSGIRVYLCPSVVKKSSCSRLWFEEQKVAQLFKLLA